MGGAGGNFGNTRGSKYISNPILNNTRVSSATKTDIYIMLLTKLARILPPL